MSWSDYKVEDTFAKKNVKRKKNTAIDRLARETKASDDAKKKSEKKKSNSKKTSAKSEKAGKANKPVKTSKTVKTEKTGKSNKSVKSEKVAKASKPANSKQTNKKNATASKQSSKNKTISEKPVSKKSSNGKKPSNNKQRANKKKESNNKSTNKQTSNQSDVEKQSDDSYELHKKNILALMSDPVYVPMKAKEIAVLLDIPKGSRYELYTILEDLVDEGKIDLNEKGCFSLPDKKDVLTGVFTAHPKGFGFVTVEGYPEDFYIPADFVGLALHHDTVEIKLLPLWEGGARREAKIKRVVSHELSQVVGTFKRTKRYAFVIPDDQKISRDFYIPEDADLGANDGDKVVLTITDFGGPGKNPAGRIIEVLGAMNEPGVDILSIVKAFGIPTEFPEDVLTQANDSFQPVSPKQMKGRRDLRDLPMVTIDGEDSKDLDDAVSLVRDGENYILGVHIADVSEYVTEKSPLDKEALRRGTSVYLTDRVIPMLPKVLSNGICSLNEGEDRLALSCIMILTPNGKVIDHEICESVVNINHRMTYHSVKLITEDRDEAERAKYADFAETFDEMLYISKKIRERRRKDGCVDFDFPETKILLDEKGFPTEIVPYEHSSANELIEDFMVLANETVAEEFCKAEIPFLYRSHEEPNADKIHDLGTFLQNFGLSLHPSGAEISPKDVQKLMNEIKGRPEEDLISRLTLRSMQQAKYTTECLGHFGLAAKYYCHFTSPIRRYPDLQIHRIIKEHLRGKLSEKRQNHYRQILPAVATQTSQLERREDEAEREVDKMKKAQYMQAHIGEEFVGKISGITGWGMYVELPNTVEGLVHVASMSDDYYVYHESTYTLVGERTGNVYQMGQMVKIVVESADPEVRTIDFRIA